MWVSNKGCTCSSIQWLPHKALHCFHVEVTQLLPYPVLAPESQVSIGAGHVSGIERPFAKWLLPSASWEMVDEDRQLPFLGRAAFLLAVASTHSGQYPANQEMPAGAGCGQFAREILDKTTFLATD